MLITKLMYLYQNECKLDEVDSPLVEFIWCSIVSMGNKFADQYSFLHFCVGAVAYYWQLSLRDAFILHFIFEIVENTPLGMRFINRFFVRSGSFGWPGGKDKPDSALNIVGDNAFFVLGWITAQKLDEVGTELGWYERHIKM